jgi:hypothetical protein
MTQAFNLSQLANKVNTSGQLNSSTGLYNQVPVANGGTGKSSVTTGALLIGAGTSAMTEVTGTGPSEILVSSPTGWTNAPQNSIGGNYIVTTYTSPAPLGYTKPATLKAVKVTVIGGGGAGGSVPTINAPFGSGGGGGGGGTIYYAPAASLPASAIPITAGPGTNSFGGFCSATGGATGAVGAPGAPAGAGGAGGQGSGGFLITTGYSGTKAAGGPGLSGSGADGSLIYGLQGAIGRNTLGAGAAAISTNYGAGGAGAWKATPNNSAYAGGAGAPGVVILEEFY